MHVTPTQILSGDIVVQGKASALAVGRQVVATVLSTAKDGLVMVSMFGKRFIVETTLDLQKDQVLNLRVHATSPKVILKPMETAPVTKLIPEVLDRLVEQIVGKFGTTPMASFDLKEIIRKLAGEQGNDPAAMQVVTRLVEEYSQLPPNTIAYLLIPFIGEDERGRAKVTMMREGNDYRLHFDVETDALGLVESTVLRTARGVSVELCSGSEDVAAFFRMHVQELARQLNPLGVLSIDVQHRKPVAAHRMNVDVLV
ncbi:MAG TPA: hypothetical protein PK350_06325 [Deltaproteobacteria bacterium]|nr:hypothetical protein [Deltaproteobacteria bacterium]HPR55314.1 hypothetical protein [Deltaproteobacteria bacterium]